MYGTVFYEDENGVLDSVSCQTSAEYEKAIEAGCRWVEDEPRLFRNIWGEPAGSAVCPICSTRYPGEFIRTCPDCGEKLQPVEAFGLAASVSTESDAVDSAEVSA